VSVFGNDGSVINVAKSSGVLLIVRLMIVGAAAEGMVVMRLYPEITGSACDGFI
jgi:hypothetical protein